jgi:hypothetical protein
MTAAAKRFCSRIWSGSGIEILQNCRNALARAPCLINQRNSHPIAESRSEHLKMVQDVISRLATCSFQLKGWVVTLAAALQVFLKGEAHAVYLFVPALPVIAFWLLDAWYLRQERLFFIFCSLIKRDHFILWHWCILSFWRPRVRPPSFLFLFFLLKGCAFLYLLIHKIRL